MGTDSHMDSQMDRMTITTASGIIKIPSQKAIKNSTWYGPANDVKKNMEPSVLTFLFLPVSVGGRLSLSQQMPFHFPHLSPPASDLASAGTPARS